MSKPICTRLNRIYRLLLAVDVNDGHLSPCVGRPNQCLQSRLIDAGSPPVTRVSSILIDDFDEIGTFGYSVINPGLRTLGASESWKLQPVFCAVTARRGCDIARGKQIRT